MAYYHRLYILALLAANPAVLFHKLNELSWYQDTLQTWVNTLKYQAGNSILELGCATGQLTHYLSRQGATAFGVDKSAKMLQRANAMNTNQAHFEFGNALDLPFKNSHFDYVVTASLLNIVTEPTTVVFEMARVCKPGGTVSVLVPQTGFEAITKLANNLKLSGFSREALMAWHRRAPKMPAEMLLQYFEQVGLHKISSELYLDGMVLTVTGVLP